MKSVKESPSVTDEILHFALHYRRGAAGPQGVGGGARTVIFPFPYPIVLPLLVPGSVRCCLRTKQGLGELLNTHMDSHFSCTPGLDLA